MHATRFVFRNQPIVQRLLFPGANFAMKTFTVVVCYMKVFMIKLLLVEAVSCSLTLHLNMLPTKCLIRLAQVLDRVTHGLITHSLHSVSSHTICLRLTLAGFISVRFHNGKRWKLFRYAAISLWKRDCITSWRRQLAVSQSKFTI